MNKFARFLVIFCILASSYYLTPLYPVYAKSPQAASMFAYDSSSSAALKLKSGVSKFKNQNFGEKVLEINEKLNELNTRKVDLMADRLNKLTSSLTKVEDQVNLLGENGVDTNVAKEKISNARSLIGKMQSALKTQKELDINMDIPTEDKALSVIKETRGKMLGDFKKHQELLIQTRQAVVDSLDSLKYLSYKND